MIRLKINNCDERKDVVVALVNAGYIVQVEEVKLTALNRDYFVWFEEKEKTKEVDPAPC